jgi:hypothetical protein
MLGIPTSVMNEAGGLVKDWLKNPLNSSFLYWYFLPAVGFVLLQLFIIGPAMGWQAPNVFEVDTSRNAVFQLVSAGVFLLILMPLIFSVLLSALAGTIFRLYQGTLPIARVAFLPWLRLNRKRSKELYGPLFAKRRDYLFLVLQGVRFLTVDGKERAEMVPESEREELANQLKQDIQTLHEELEASPDLPVGLSDLAQPVAAHNLPVDFTKAGATDLANALSVPEEDPLQRYSIDTKVFWPRMVEEIEPAKSESLTLTFGAMNGLLNISLLSYLFAIEALIVGVARWIRPGGSLIKPGWLFLAAAIGIPIGRGAYRGAVRAAHSVGNALRTAFDYHRELILKRFKLKLPEDNVEERLLWLKLAAYIRRGESFYYPAEFRGDG